MKFTAEEISKMIGNALQSDEQKPVAKDDSKIDALSSKFDRLIETISKMVTVEKPKSTEEIVTEVVEKAIAKALPKKAEEENKNKKISDMTADEFCGIFGKAIADSLSKVVKSDKPKGKKSEDEEVDNMLDALGKSIGVDEDTDEDTDDEEDDKPRKTGKEVKVDTVESHDKQGNAIPVEKRAKMQELDDWIGTNLGKKYQQLKKDSE